MTKEELREKWTRYFRGSSADEADSVIAFNWFWPEIESRDNRIKELEEQVEIAYNNGMAKGFFNGVHASNKLP